KMMAVRCIEFEKKSLNKLANKQMSKVFFFFQAEDGIRDRTVTGVQTCALPICSAPTPTPLAMSGGTINWSRGGHGAPSAGASCEDRKSTRLNSSHRTISYAVFCLKKKKAHQHPYGRRRHAQGQRLRHRKSADR